MSPAHDGVRERGTWRAAAIIAVALAVPVAPNDAVRIEPGTVRSSQPVKHEPAEKRSKKRAKKHNKKDKENAPTVEDLIRDEWGKHAKAALRVAHCESKLDPSARSYAGARGVFQIMPVHRWRMAKIRGEAKDLDDPLTNIRVARHLHRDEGWRPWTCARRLGLTA